MDKILKEKITSIENSIKSLEKEFTLKDAKVSVLDGKIKDLKESLNSIFDKVQKFEIKMEAMHIRTTDSENKWSNITDFVVKIFWVVIVSYLLYKLGIQAPPI